MPSDSLPLHSLPTLFASQVIAISTSSGFVKLIFLEDISHDASLPRVAIAIPTEVLLRLADCLGEMAISIRMGNAVGVRGTPN